MTCLDMFLTDLLFHFSFYLFVVLTIYFKSRMQKLTLEIILLYNQNRRQICVKHFFCSIILLLTWRPLYLWILYIIRNMICLPIISFIIGKMQKNELQKRYKCGLLLSFNSSRIFGLVIKQLVIETWYLKNDRIIGRYIPRNTCVLNLDQCSER